ncbi:MAG: hypothetical protein UZ02_AOB001000980, partial [Nitrosomonas europaea]
FHTCSSQTAVTIGIFLQIILMVLFCGNVIFQGQDFGRDLAIAGCCQCLLIDFSGSQCKCFLAFVMVINSTAVIAADIIALAVA